MKLISASNEYRAINLIKRDPRYSIYKCVSRDSGRGYLLYKIIKDEMLENALVARFNDISSDFDGFYELFADGDDSLILVFKDNTLEETAADYMSDDTGESAKLLFFERVLEALCVHEVPANIACDLLEHDNIGVKSDGGADCLYILNDISVFEKRNMTTFSEIFAKKLNLSLSPIGRTKRTPVIEKFCEDLRTNPPETMTDLYDRYIGCAEACSGIDSGETKAERLKNKVMKAANIGKAVLTAAVLGLACLILIMSFAEDGSKNSQKFDKIGEVVIEETVSE